MGAFTRRERSDDFPRPLCRHGIPSGHETPTQPFAVVSITRPSAWDVDQEPPGAPAQSLTRMSSALTPNPSARAPTPDRPHAAPAPLTSSSGQARSRRALRPRSMIQRRLPRECLPYGRSVRPAIAQTRRHRYSHSCVEPSLWLRHRFHKPRPGFETHRRRGPSNGIDKATLAARLLGHCRREHARPLFWGQAYLSVAAAYLEAQR